MEKQEETSEVLFVGCMFLGMGIGFLLDQIGAGMFIGMGVGFIASAFYKKEKETKEQ